MSSCVNQVYDSSNAYFQASVTIPSGGDILGGYDASLNKLIFAYENTCDPAKVTDLTSGWTSSGNAVSTSKIGLDNNCPATDANVLLYYTPNAYTGGFIIAQMAIFTDPESLDTVVVCGGSCTKIIPPSLSLPYGFLFSFKLATGEPFTKFDSGSAPFGWFIKENGSDQNNNYTQINTIYTAYFSSTSTIIYGGIQQVDINGSYFQRPLLEKKVITNVGVVTTTPLKVNDFTDHDNTTLYNLISIVDIISGGSNDSCIPIYQTSNFIPTDTFSVHIRELDFTTNVTDVSGTWKTPDFPLPEQSLTPMAPSTATGWASSEIKYTSSCVGAIGSDVWYIAATGTLTGGAPGTYPMIYAIGYNANNTEMKLIPSFSNNRQESYFFSPEGVKIYIPDPPGLGAGQGNQGPGDDLTDWKGLQIDNISYITKNAIQPFLSSSGDDLFVTLSPKDGAQTRFLSFISALNSNPDVNILNAIGDEKTPSWELTLFKVPRNFLKVKFDSQLTGTLNDLQFKLNFCSSTLYLFAFGNYVNSPAQASVSAGLLLNAISNICLSKGTQILCDQGIINIEKINTRKHTINNRPINHITQSIHTDDYLIKIKKNCLSSNSPSSDIICSGDHKILYKNNLIEAKNLINEVYGIEKIKNDKRVLYNILMDKHEVIMANNTPVESLHPQNIIAMFYNNYNNPQAREFLSDKIGQMNKNNHYITEANKTNSIHLRNGTSKKTSIPLRIGNKK